MLTLTNGKIYINNKECNNPELVFFTLKDLAEEGAFELINVNALEECIGQLTQH